MKKIEPWLNTFTPLVTYLFRCNTDVTSLSSGTAIKAVVLYVSDYITKTTLKTHTIFDSIRSVFHKNGEMIGGTLPMQEKARRIMTKIVNLLSAKAEMGSPMICMYLLENPDHYTSHIFVPFYWQSFVTQVKQDFDADKQEVQKITLIKKKGKIVGLSPVYDYIYRSPDLEDVSLYDWVQRFQRKKVKKSRSENCPTAETNELIDVDCDVSFESVTEIDDRRKARNIFHFTEMHSLHDSHASQLISNHEKRVPNFIGANLPICDQGDREYYCCTMLTLFKPWRRGHDLKKSLQTSWDDTFNKHEFKNREVQLMKNFNIRYECLDARDDYRAQLKNGIDKSLMGSWEVFQDDDGCEIESFQRTIQNDIMYDDIPVDPKAHGKNFLLRLKNMEMMKMILTDNGWINAKTSSASQTSNAFKPDRFLSSHEWEAEVKKMKQKILDKRNENNKVTSEVDSKLNTSCDFKENIVKIIDKSYLEKSFVTGEHANRIDETVLKFSLNKEQERAFRIVANHSVSPHQDQLKMYLGGMGGTGKSRVLAALSDFFALQKEAHRFVIVAPTGSAAALLGGSTYHSMFGINDFNTSKSQLSQVKANLAGVEYVFFDEVSMLSARDLYRISNQLSKVFNTPEDSFGGLNMVFSGDFAQLPPAVGGEGVSLYSRSIGAIASSMRSQEEAIGKALWHQVTTVVILRQNMRQKIQSALDNQLRTALENMRYKACTPEDIRFLRTRISSNLPNRPSVCDDNFRNVSIITAKNLHKDEINKLGAIRFAQETGQKLTNFYSEDSANLNNNEKKTSGALRIKEITDEIQMSLWSQTPSSTDKNIAGKLSLCIGLPVMIRYNFATELCMTRGQEGYIHGWQSRMGEKNQLALDTLFIKLKNPPSEVQFEGLPLNVVPIYPTTNNIYASLPNDDRILITRTQVEVLVNFSMTDFGSQGKTRLYNVSDLNNLQTHQSYYTALSRSASAEGTLILQGFDPRKITGKCSGALRQEFRELEILDEITRLRYEGKLSIKVHGDIRNTLIKTFREWKGLQYVPNIVHSAIRWSKRDPLFESEIIDIKKITSSMKTENKTKRKMDDDVSSELKKNQSFTKIVDPESKKLCLFRPSSDGSNHYLIPQGMIWSNNSCAYDSIFTILFSIWCNNRNLWNYNFHRMDNPFIVALSNGFNDVDNNIKTLETIRDDV